MKVIGTVANYNYQRNFATAKDGRKIPYVNLFWKVKNDFFWCHTCHMWATYDDNGWVTCWCV